MPADLRGGTSGEMGFATSEPVVNHRLSIEIPNARVISTSRTFFSDSSNTALNPILSQFIDPVMRATPVNAAVIPEQAQTAELNVNEDRNRDRK